MKISAQLDNYTLVPFVKFEHAPENLRLCYKNSGGQVANRLDYEVKWSLRAKRKLKATTMPSLTRGQL